MYQDSNGKRWTRSSPEIIKRARRLRQRMTPAEEVLWEAVRDRRLDGLKFRRQCVLGPYIFDFFCRELNLVIELDGAGHRDAHQRDRDADRDAMCIAYGYRVLRLANRRVLGDLTSVIAAIRAIATSPFPLSPK